MKDMTKFKENSASFTVEKYLPHNFLAEKTILSSLLVSSEAIESCLRSLTVETFYFKNHQELYKAILAMYRRKLPIDIITVNSFLQDNGLLSKIGGIKVLIELINHVPNLLYLDNYIKLVQDKFLRRSLIKFGYEAINSGYITNLPLEEILNTLEGKLFNLTNEIQNSDILW